MTTRKILLVDDQPETLEAIADLFAEEGLPYLIMKAPSGSIALRVIEKEIPDLIITDWEMPEMDGIHLIKQLKKDKRTADIPVIMNTGVMTSSENLETALQAGAVDYIRKPVDKIELIARTKANLHLADNYKKIKKLNASKDKFFSIIAHDLKAPFNSLLGFSDLLTKEVQDNNFERAVEYAHIIHDVSNQSYKLLNNLLDWSMAQTGRLDFKPEKIILTNLSHSLVEYFNKLAHEKKITITSTIKPNIEVFADPNMFATIIRNLLSNAIKYTQQGGEITISASEGINATKVSVRDTGIGIKPEDLEKLFRIEETMSTNGTEDEKGTGLGLLLCHDFIEKHNGKIWVESEVGEGSVFHFTLPRV